MSVGSNGESLACSFLERIGYEILERNYHSRFGEIDIIAKDKDCLVFVEVKTRSNLSFGTPLEAISYKKMQKIIKTSQFYINRLRLGDIDFRFDAIEVFLQNGEAEINHIKNITL
jgi:putative endonuclease